MPFREGDVRGARCVLAGVISVKDKDAPARLDELEAMLRRAGAIVLARVVQRRGVSRGRNHASAMNTRAVMSVATVLGSGKTKELTDVVQREDADTVVFLNPLRTAQAARIASLTGCRVLSA